MQESLTIDLKKRYEGIADRITLYTPFVSNEKDDSWQGYLIEHLLLS